MLEVLCLIIILLTLCVFQVVFRVKLCKDVEIFTKRAELALIQLEVPVLQVFVVSTMLETSLDLDKVVISTIV